MLRLTLLLFVFFFSFIQAQSLNDAFLKSLPKALGAELTELDESEEDDETLKNQLPDTRISKTEAALKKIQRELNAVEIQLAYEQGQSIEGLKRFGEDFFNTFQSSFSPANLPNPPLDYRLGSGDFLKIQIIGGGIDDSSTLKLESDASINIPKIGKIFLGGMTLAEAAEFIESKVSTILVGSKAFITLSDARNKSVMVIGGVSFPGMYTVPSEANIISILIASGGISENGSFREIIHKRNNEIIGTFDLYNFISLGNTLEGFSIRDGDTISVSSIRDQVTLSGAIAKTAIYEKKSDETLSDLIKFAGGILPSFTNEINLFRSGLTSTILVDETNLLNGDLIIFNQYAPSLIESRLATITGEVKNPGIYSIEEGERLSDIVAKAGGYTEFAYPEGGILYRESVAVIQSDYFKKSYIDLVNFLASSSSGAASGSLISTSTNLEFILKEIQSVKPKGRISAEFNLPKLLSNESLNIFLEDNDVIFIPRFSNSVVLVGEVQVIGALTYQPHLSAHDYIDLSGGLTKFADNQRIIIIKPDGSAVTTSGKLNYLLNRNKDEILPGSIIYVPKEIGKIEGINLAATIAPIASSLALSIASLNAID